MKFSPMEAAPFIEIGEVEFFRTRHTRRDTDQKISYSPADEPGYCWRRLECQIVLTTTVFIDEIQIDMLLRDDINGGNMRDVLFGQTDPEGYYWWRVINTDFNYESGTPDEPKVILTVTYTAWEKERVR